MIDFMLSVSLANLVARCQLLLVILSITWYDFLQHAQFYLVKKIQETTDGEWESKQQ